MNAKRLQGPRGIFNKGLQKQVVAHSFFVLKDQIRRPCWQWIARDEDSKVIVVYEVECWSDSGENGALWQLRELASAALRDARAHRGF